ncbi:NAD(P)H-hydrate dehydratase [Nocardioides caldifontis]|uniref:NAD(P)H-hydrate dehydratase n=1 Tax=Nocardioides caldifontis TaxID=2588938 RepID=UPI0011E05410|nr:NAD(P)H-hydrate dehydratase [Nocardioides caldifontis]
MAEPAPTPVTEPLLRDWALPAPGDDKHARGTVLVVGGSAQTPGAVLLAGEAALRAGGGKLRIATEASACAPVAVAAPESRVLPLPGEGEDGALGSRAASAVVRETGSAEVVLLGPGLVDVDHALAFMEGVVPELEGRVVVDALGSVFVTHHPDGLAHLDGCVLTVNPTELSRILDRDEDEVERDPARAASDAARRTGAVVLCGGTSKWTAAPDGRCWVADVGGPGLGVSGSGDTQAGIVAGLVARGADPVQAAVWGGYLHGRAGEVLAQEVGAVGFLAREVPGRVPALLTALSD